jgi:hypothetical protein
VIDLRGFPIGLLVVVSALGVSSVAATPSAQMATMTSKTTNQGAIPGGRSEFKGPGYICGWSFALELNANETATKTDPGIDFETVSVTSPAGRFLLYEGNAPQPADKLVETGINFPSVIAIHLPTGGAKADVRAIERRLVLGTARSEICGNVGAES